jgi:hypothetical protein
MGIIGGLTGKNSEGRLVAVACTTSVNTFFAGRLALVAFDLPYPIVK